MSNDAVVVAEASPEMRVRAQAAADIDDILALRRVPSFARYFLRRLEEKAAPIRADLLRSKLSIEDFREKQTRLLVLEEIAGLLDADEQGNRNILRA